MSGGKSAPGLGVQGLCCANLCKKFPFSKRKLISLGSRMVMCSQRFGQWPYVCVLLCAWHLSVWTNCCSMCCFLGFVLLRLKWILAAFSGWERQNMGSQPGVCICWVLSMFSSLVCKWQNAHVPLEDFGNCFQCCPSRGQKSWTQFREMLYQLPTVDKQLGFLLCLVFFSSYCKFTRQPDWRDLLQLFRI